MTFSFMGFLLPHLLLLVLERAWEAWERKKTIYEVRQTRVCTLNVS